MYTIDKVAFSEPREEIVHGPIRKARASVEPPSSIYTSEWKIREEQFLLKVRQRASFEKGKNIDSGERALGETGFAHLLLRDRREFAVTAIRRTVERFACNRERLIGFSLDRIYSYGGVILRASEECAHAR